LKNVKDHNWQLRKTVLVYLILTLTAIAVNNIYALFGHGVHSASMTWMFLYLLIGGGIGYFLMERFIPGVVNAGGYQLFFNLYNSGLATLTVGSFLKGILEIAGTNSPYTIVFYITGGLFTAAGLIALTQVRDGS
jgi:hypothetical protein